MKKTKVVKIKIDDKTEKGFKVNELSIGEIIDLCQSNALFGATLNDNKETTGNDKEIAKDDGNDAANDAGGLVSVADQLKSFTDSALGVMEASCDFDFNDVKVLSPSEIEEVFEGWLEVNQTFLKWLDQIGIKAAVKVVMEQAISDFLGTVAI